MINSTSKFILRHPRWLSEGVHLVHFILCILKYTHSCEQTATNAKQTFYLQQFKSTLSHSNLWKNRTTQKPSPFSKVQWPKVSCNTSVYFVCRNNIRGECIIHVVHHCKVSYIEFYDVSYCRLHVFHGHWSCVFNFKKAVQLWIHIFSNTYIFM